MGVEQCGRPGHRAIDSHAWKHKRPPEREQGASSFFCWGGGGGFRV